MSKDDLYDRVMGRVNAHQIATSAALTDTPTPKSPDRAPSGAGAVTHVLRRTSPMGKGSPFIGTCVLCGTPNLPSSAVLGPCPNQHGLTGDEALIECIKGDEP